MLLNRTCLISFQWIKMIVSDVVKTLEKRKFLKRKPHSGPEGRRFLQRHFHQTRSEIHRESRVVAGYSRTYREITDEEAHPHLRSLRRSADRAAQARRV